MICPDCNTGLRPGAASCKCGWEAAPPPKSKPDPKATTHPRVPQFEPLLPRTEAERAQAARALALIHPLVAKMTGRSGRPKLPGAPQTAIEKIVECKHDEWSKPFPANRFGCGGHAKRCLECGKVDLVMLTPFELAALAEDERRERKRAAIQSES